jgi:hypothetical protein
VSSQNIDFREMRVVGVGAWPEPKGETMTLQQTSIVIGVTRIMRNRNDNVK